MFSALGEKDQILMKFSLFQVLSIFLIFLIFSKMFEIYENITFSAPLPPKAGNVALAQGFY